MAETARIFIGFDSKEVVAYHVLAQSIIEHASTPVAFSPIVLSHLQGLFTRERNALQSTEFSFSRFMVPYLSGYEGWSLFVDCDMLACADIAELWSLRDERFAVMCVKHDYQPKTETKFLGQTQTKYQKKNWSSVMLFNNRRCRALTPDFVNTATGLELHQFKWLDGDDQIGELPQRLEPSGQRIQRPRRCQARSLHRRRPVFRRVSQRRLCRGVVRHARARAACDAAPAGVRRPGQFQERLSAPTGRRRVFASGILL